MDYGILNMDLPYRECKNCENIEHCHNLEIEEGTGLVLLPHDCPKEEIRSKELETKPPQGKINYK